MHSHIPVLNPVKFKYSIPATTIITALFSLSCQQAAALDIADGTNLYGVTATNGDTWNLLGNAYLSNSPNSSVSKSLPTTLTINGTSGGSTITLNDGSGHYVKLTGSSTLNVNNVTFTGGNAIGSSNDGGAILASNLVISGGPVTFDSNTAGRYGGAIRASGSVQFTGGDVTLTNNTAGDDGYSSGGAIYATSIAFTDPTATVTVSDNTGSRSGGGLWSNSSTTIAGNAVFRNNSSGLAANYGYGGAIRTVSFTANNPDATLTFDGNKAYSGGGGLNGDSTLTIAGTAIFTNNTTETGHGGAIRIGSGTHTLNLTNANVTTIVTGSFAGNNGGGIYVGNIQAAGSLTLTGNTAGVNGGGLFNNNTVTSSIGNTSATLTINGNKAGFNKSGVAINANGNGGAIYSNGALTLTGNTINLSNNQATGDGGALWLASSGQIQGATTINGNSALNGSGGAIYTTSTLTLSGSTISLTGNSAAADGGALWLTGNSLLQGKVTIDGNTAANGGAIYTSSLSTLTATDNTVIRNNSASSLGGAYWAGGDLALNATTGNIQFQNNQHHTGSSATANALYLNNNAGNARLELEAADGHSITFLDPIESNQGNGLVTVEINGGGGNGKVLFSGELYSNAADRTSSLYGNTTVYAGTLELKDNVTYGGIGNTGHFQLDGPAELLTTATNANTVNTVRAQTIELAGNTTFTGSATQTLVLDGDVTQSGQLTLANGMPGNTVMITGDYIANNTRLIFNTALGDDYSLTDRLNITGDTTGNGVIQVNNVNGQGALTVNGIKLIDVQGQSNASFTLSGRVVAGLYEYDLYHDTTGDGGWYLRSLDNYVPGPDPTPTPQTLRPEFSAYLQNQTIASTMFMHTLHDRLGEPQYTDTYKNNGHVPAIWVRITGNRTSNRAINGQFDNDTDTATVQFGGDLARWYNDSGNRLHLGLMGGYGYSKTDAKARTGYTSTPYSGFRRIANGKVEGYSIGGYATWYGNQDKPTGPYLDLWAQHSWFDNKVQGKNLKEESYRSAGWTVSIEGGYALIASDSNTRQWIIEPQAQLAYNGYRADNHNESNGTRITGSDADGLISRIGARFYSRSKLNDNGIQPFIETNWWYSDAQNALTFEGIQMSGDTPDSRYELKAGLQGEIAKGWQMWGHIGGQWGERQYSRYEGMFGVKHTF